MPRPSFVVGLTLVGCSAWNVEAGMNSFLQGMAGQSAMDYSGLCDSLGKQYQGYSWRSAGNEKTFAVTCSGDKVNVVCHGNPFTSCSGPPGVGDDRRMPRDEFESDPAPPPASYKGSHGSKFSQGQVDHMVDMHNQMRCAVGTPKVSWNNALAAQAQRVADKCAFAHSNAFQAPIPAGENLATGSSVDEAVWMWFTEYAQGSPATFNTAGHFTAMVWKDTKEIGCGVCRDGQGLVVCHYSNSPGNMMGEFRNNVPAFRGEPRKYRKCGLDKALERKKIAMYRGWGILNPVMLFDSPGFLQNGESLSKSSTMALMGVCGSAVLALAGVFVTKRLRAVRSAETESELLPMDGEEQ